MWFDDDDLDIKLFQVGKKEFTNFEDAKCLAIKKATKKAIKCNGEGIVEISCWHQEGDDEEPQWYFASVIRASLTIMVDDEKVY